MFTQDNTEGYTAAELETLNRALAYLLADYSPELPDYEQHVKRFSDRINNNVIDGFTFEDLIR